MIIEHWEYFYYSLLPYFEHYFKKDATNGTFATHWTLETHPDFTKNLSNLWGNNDKLAAFWTENNLAKIGMDSGLALILDCPLWQLVHWQDEDSGAKPLPKDLKGQQAELVSGTRTWSVKVSPHWQLHTKSVLSYSIRPGCFTRIGQDIQSILQLLLHLVLHWLMDPFAGHAITAIFKTWSPSALKSKHPGRVDFQILQHLGHCHCEKVHWDYSTVLLKLSKSKLFQISLDNFYNWQKESRSKTVPHRE